MYCGLSTASEVFLIFTTQLYQYFSVLLLFALFSDEPEVFLPEYSQTAILHASHFRRVVNSENTYQVSIDVAIWKHHGWVVLVERLARHVANESRLGAVCEGQRPTELVEMFTAHRAVWVTCCLILLVAVS